MTLSKPIEFQSIDIKNKYYYIFFIILYSQKLIKKTTHKNPLKHNTVLAFSSKIDCTKKVRFFCTKLKCKINFYWPTKNKFLLFDIYKSIYQDNNRSKLLLIVLDFFKIFDYIYES